MNLQTFRAPTMAEALSQVKGAMGSEAVILHTRTYRRKQWFGLRWQEVVEITAGRGLHLAPRPRREPVRMGAVAANTKAPTIQPNLTTSMPPGRQFMETPTASNVMIKGVSQQISDLQIIVGDLVKENRQRQAPNVPEEL